MIKFRTKDVLSDYAKSIIEKHPEYFANIDDRNLPNRDYCL